jgi:hypothetical protein
VTESVWLVIAGGVVGIVASLVLLLQRGWQREDRRRAADAKALEAAVDKLMAWQDYAMKALSSGETGSARDRRIELDTSWGADFALIPDQEATRELIALSRDAYFFAGARRAAPDLMERTDRLIKLQDRVIQSAQTRRRELA